MSIYVKFKPPKTLQAFLKKFFSAFNGHAVQTFTDEKCTKQQCRAYANRSIQDLLECVKTYYPSITQKALVRTLGKLRIKGENETLFFYPFYCGDIRRPVISWDEKLFKHKHLSDAGVAWANIFEEVGITSVEELYGK